MLRRELIGTTMSFTAPNGCPMTLTINDQDTKLYKKLGLDVFHKINAKELKPLKPENMKWPELKAYAKKNGFEGKNKKEILNAIAESNK
jgi:hypothetical protein